MKTANGALAATAVLATGTLAAGGDRAPSGGRRSRVVRNPALGYSPGAASTAVAPVDGIIGPLTWQALVTEALAG